VNKILITGGSGLVGQYLKNLMPEAIYISSSDYDLRYIEQVEQMYNTYQPNTVIHLAARVAGIQTNMAYPTEYLSDNILMNVNVINGAYKHKVDRLIATVSTCCYPDKVAKYPMTEDMLLQGPPASSNIGYAYSKRCMSLLIDSYNKQHGTEWNYLIPCNLYGEHDEFDNFKSHMVSALIKKIYESNKTVNLLGTGKPIRQFMFAGDLARAIKEIIDRNIRENLNVVPEEIFSIKEIAEIGINACGKPHLKLRFDPEKPDGQFRKDATSKKLLSLIPDFKFTSLFEGIKKTYDTYSKGMQNG
jgi:GDP-L-fucose synthase